MPEGAIQLSQLSHLLIMLLVTPQHPCPAMFSGPQARACLLIGPCASAGRWHVCELPAACTSLPLTEIPTPLPMLLPSSRAFAQ